LFSGLVRLGGRRTCESLAKFSKDRRDELTNGAVSALVAIARRGKVQARFAGLALGDFVVDSKVEAAVTAALAGLAGTGNDAVPGLLRALETKSPDTELQVIQALSSLADERAAPSLAARIEEKGDAVHRDAAADALRKIGMPAVPALIDALKARKTRRYAGIVLYDVTGQTFGEDVKAWISWWSARK
jgi:hypothetical protein